MNSTRRLVLRAAALGLIAGSCLTAADPLSAPGSAEIKRITDRYNLTRSRINSLLEMRLHPAPLPANPPNPFYQAVEEMTPLPKDPIEAPLPETGNLDDVDVLRKYATTLKVSGVITLNGVLHVSVNNTAAKVGDVITVGSKDHPTYLKVVAISLSEFTLGLNDATLVVPIKK